MKETVRKFVHIENPALIKDIWFSAMLYGCSYDEYFLFGFERLSSVQRNEFFCDKERFVVLRPMYDFEKYETIRNKMAAFEFFRKFYKRDMIYIDEKIPYRDFEAFCKKHSRFLFKPERGCCGQGICKYEVNPENAVELKAQYEVLRKQKGVLDEVITQSAEMAEFNPSSVNTVRLITWLQENNEVSYAFGFFRTGRVGSVVDNGGAGGVFSAIDEKTGKVASFGADEKGKHYEVHPDSGKAFKEFEIPDWKEALKIGAEVAHKADFARHLGLDLAHTSEGWKLVEVNPFPQFLAQIATGKGTKKEIMEMAEQCRG